MSQKYYSTEHEWIEIQTDNIAKVGISDYAQESLGDIVYVELPEIGKKVTQSKDVAVVESAKAASDIYAPVSGEIVGINDILNDTPELINQSPEKEAWLFLIKIEHENEIKNLMNETEYQEFIKGL